MYISGNIYVVIVICTIVIMSAIIIVYNTHMLMRDVDEFTNCNAGYCSISRQSEKQPATASVLPEGNHLGKFHDFTDIKEKHPLKLYGCINVPFSDELVTKLEHYCYISHQEFYSASIYNIYDKIAEDVHRTKGRVKTELVLDPIYAIIYQDDNCFADDEQQKLTKIIVIYPMYELGDNGAFKENKTGVKHCHSFFDKYVDKALSNLQKCQGTVYLLNRNHKLFYDVIKKRENVIL
jgi:hypothetical protein